jgi:hypothetical protein
MKRIQQLTVLCLVLILAAMAAPSAMAATQSTPPGKAGIPAQIFSARTIFIANGGASVDTFGDPNLAFEEFYAGMKNWGRYQLAASPAAADLVYQISVTGTVVQTDPHHTLVVPMVVMTILDPESNVVLWRCTEQVETAILLSNQRKNFIAAVEASVTDAMALVSPIPHAQ